MDAAARIRSLEDGRKLTRCPAFADPGGERNASHRLSGHTPVWAYCPPDLAQPFLPELARPPLFQFLTPDASPAAVAAATANVCFLGACRSQVFTYFHDRTDCRLVVVEPEAQPMAAFLEGGDLRDGVHLIWGDWQSLGRPLSRLAALDDGGAFPVFYVQEGLESGDGSSLGRFREQVEVLFYRRTIYPVAVDKLFGALPIRPMRPGPFYDQQKHVYENCFRLEGASDLTALRRSLRGETALLVGAGPELANMVGSIRDAADRAVVIAVNSAVRPLVRAGVTPHFAVINDGSVPVEATLQGLGPGLETMLAGHVHAGWGDPGTFSRLLPFGAADLPGRRPELRVYGSVLSAAFSLAEWLGCDEAVLAGFQLASADPWSLSYAPGTVQESGRRPKERPLTHGFPQLYPVRGHAGERLFTSLNFRDVALWMQERAQSSRMRTVNATAGSILHGPGLEVDVGHVLQGRPGVGKRVAALRDSVPAITAPDGLQGYVDRERSFWDEVARETGAALELPPHRLVEQGAALLTRYDAGVVSRRLCSFPGFDNARFSDAVFGGRDPIRVHRAFGRYLETAHAMAREFVALLG